MGVEEEYRRSTRGLALLFGAALVVLILAVWASSRFGGGDEPAPAGETIARP